MRISLGDFVDYVLASGSPKLTKARTMLKRGEYHPGRDFWKPLRDGIVAFHTEGRKDTKELERILAEVYERKRGRYRVSIAGYRKLLRNAAWEWLTPPRGEMALGGSHRVMVNPEIGLKVGGKSYAIKLYFKNEPLSARKVGVVLVLMHDKLGQATRSWEERRFGVLDVPNGRLFAQDPDLSLRPLLKAEGLGLAAMLDELEQLAKEPAA